MSRLPALVLGACLAVTSAHAADALAVSRAGDARAQAKLQEIQSRQAALQTEMNGLAARIETLKAQQKGALLPGGELDASLRRSQVLSGELSGAARELSAARAEAQQQDVALLASLAQATDELKTRWEKAGRDERRNLLSQLRALRGEREQVRARLPATAVPALTASPSDDPEDLLEQADALRDSEDKVRLRMHQLEARIHELKDERELDRRMKDFLGDEAMFDEQDRRLRASTNETLMSDGRGSVQAGTGPANLGGGAFPNSPPSPAPSGFSSQSARAEDARPTVGDVSKGAGDTDDVKSLEAQLGQLGTAANRLEQQAKDMERRAKDLQ